MRTLHLVKTGSGASWALRQMRELVRLGVDVHVAVPDGPLVPRYTAAGVTVHPVQLQFPSRRPWRWPSVRRAMRELVSRVDPDVIHSHFVQTTLTMRLALGADHGVPRIFQVPGPLHLEHAAIRAAEIRTAGRPDFWIATCQWVYDRYRSSGVPDDRLRLSYYGCDVEAFATIPNGRLRSELDVAADAPLVGMVAYMYAPKRFLGQARGLKGHEDFIDAMAIVRRHDDRVVGACIGGAWDGARSYEAKIRAYGSRRLGETMRFLGTRSDVLELYADLDAAVHPSHSENVGGAVESLLSGVPTITSNVGGFPDLVIPGRTGRLVPPRDPQSLAAAILETLADRGAARELARRGREKAAAMFDSRSTALQIKEIYQHVLSS